MSSTCVFTYDDEPPVPPPRPMTTGAPRPVQRPLVRPPLAPRWRLGAGAGHSWTTLLFSGDRSFSALMNKTAVSISAEYRATNRLSVSASTGAIVTGTMAIANDRFDLLPGFLAAVTASYRLIDARGEAPFLLASATMAVSVQGTRQRNTDPALAAPNMIGIDLRASVLVGRTFAARFTPYLVVRAFGGPVFWQYSGRAVTGTDQFHYQLGTGAVLRVGPVDFFAELIPFGEGSLAGGAGASF